MDSLFGAVREYDFVSGSASWDDDFFDRVNHWWTAVVLILSAVILSAKQYVGNPIQCWMPQQFTGAWTQYAENYCWIQGTYFVPQRSEIPADHGVRYERQLSYYQWVPYVLCLQALMFYIPHMVWRMFNWYSGVNVQSLVTMACDAGNVDPSKREGNITTLARYIEDALIVIGEAKDSVFTRMRRCVLCLCGTRRMGNYLTSLYLVVKILYIVNVIGQFFLLNKFLGTKYTFYGFQMLRDLVQGHEWKESGHFPRITMCDFEIRAMGKQRHNYTVQCVLMINLFNEKIYIFLWFWFFIVAVVSIFSFFYWVFRMIPVFQRARFVQRFLKISRTLNKSKHRDVFNSFVEKRLKTDGVFLIRLIDLNAGDIVATDLITAMWKRYKVSRPELANDSDKEDEAFV